jgi:two-component system chemotaxis sensor kinase CheA
MDEILKEFLKESFETVAGLEQELTSLESDPSNPEALTTAYRHVHTIKGACGFLGLGKLENLTATAETLLGRMQSGRIKPTAEVLPVLSDLAVSVRRILDSIEATGSEGDTEHDELLVRLEAIAQSCEE